MKERIIKRIDYNWFVDGIHGPKWETFDITQEAVKRIIDVSEHGSTCYRVEFRSGEAVLIFNPNMVTDREEVEAATAGELRKSFLGDLRTLCNKHRCRLHAQDGQDPAMFSGPGHTWEFTLDETACGELRKAVG